ncbi:MAG: pyridoxamine kinase [Clostridia bacterium]|nr:pyridoxamine kinase [Clostridia bacterium]
MKRILTIQDISCVGRCSLTVALPIISAAGVEAGVLPTAVLSTHTMFPKFTFCDLTDEIEGISNAFSELNIGFDAIYTGYLGSFRQLGLVSDLIDQHRTENNLVVIDPAMADNGKLYPAFSPEFARAMAGLCGKADLIIPNLTEAAFMLDIPYTENYDEEYIRDLLKKLTGLGAKCAALTGISFEEGKLGVYCYDSVNDKYFSYFNERMPVAYHGTGDIFASATLGALMRGHSVESALAVAVDFTLECIKLTMADENRRFYGVNFEEALPYYIERLKKAL